MAIAKLSLFLVTVIAQQYSITPPNAAPPAEQLREQRGVEPRVPYVMATLETLLWSWAVVEGLVLFVLSSQCPSMLARPLLHALLDSRVSSDHTTTLKTPTAAFITGTLLSVAGALLRARSYHVLGRHFTFELSIRGPVHTHPPTSDSAHSSAHTAGAHVLITHDIYSIVRHPSYTASAVLAVGWLLCVLDRRGSTVAAASTSLAWCQRWWYGYDVGVHPTVTMAVLASLWTAALAVVYKGLVARMDKEDVMLEEHFGETWRAWAKRVPWRLIPGIY